MKRYDGRPGYLAVEMNPGERVFGLLMAALFALLCISGTGRAEPASYRKRSARKPVTITADRMEADNKKNFVVFRGNVAAEEDFLICSDELYLRYGEGQRVDKLTATGSVRIYQDDKESLSDNAVYDREARTIVLTGGPVVRQCTDTVRGDKITVYVDEDRVVVESQGGSRVKAVIMPNKKCGESAGSGAVSPLGESGGETRCKRAR